MRVAIVGCGGQGRIHSAAFAQLEGIQLVGCCDIAVEKAQELANQFGATAFTDYTEMLAALRPDLVSVCTPENHHAGPTIAALQSGAHVLCEKMLASSLDEARAMVQTAHDNKRFLATQFNYRFIPAIQWLKALLQNGILGDPLLVVLISHAYCHHHGLDLLRFLFGEIVAVQASVRGDRRESPYLQKVDISEDLLYIPPRGMGGIVHFKQGFLGILASSHYYDFRDLMLELHLLTTKGRLSLRRMRWDNINGELDTNLDLSDLSPSFTPIPFNATFPPAIRAFVAAIRGEASDVATGEDGLRAMEIEHALLVAHKTGQTVLLP